LLLKNIREYYQSRGISFIFVAVQGAGNALKAPRPGLTGNGITLSRSGTLHFMNTRSEQYKRAFVLC
jgi:hypothetical protein